MFYGLIASTVKETYEKAPGMAIAPGRSGYAITIGLVLMYIIDFWAGLEIFFMLQGVIDPTSSSCLLCSAMVESGKQAMLVYSALRITAFCIGNAGAIVASDAHDKGLCGMLAAKIPEKHKQLTKYMVIVLNCGLLVACCPITGEVYYLLDEVYGFTNLETLRADPVHGTEFARCLDAFGTSAECISLQAYP